LAVGGVDGAINLLARSAFNGGGICAGSDVGCGLLMVTVPSVRTGSSGAAALVANAASIAAHKGLMECITAQFLNCLYAISMRLFSHFWLKRRMDIA
jgi:hypothetical protein